MAAYYGCLYCRHLQDDGNCKAFPGGIPLEILSGEIRHTDPLPNQKENVVFELKKPQATKRDGYNAIMSERRIRP